MTQALPPITLGDRLRAVRNVRGLSLRAAADPAGISPAYLQKLESGVVASPSPHALFGLAGVLDVEYGELLSLAGYPVPGEPPTTPSRVPTLIADALGSEPLDDDEARQLAEYLAFLRHQRRSAPAN
ncbi:MAG: transcriptional regulator, family [Conexibacter sp.]|nr:transcriptional regulator, family [Conexibacter sp.]